MARMKANKDAKPRGNPYKGMGDAELAKEWGSLLAAYADRLEYFAALPDWQNAGNLKAIGENPGAWGLSRGEYSEWLDALREHVREGARLSRAGSVRRGRMMEAERARVAAMPSWDEARAEIGKHEARYEPFLMDGETVIRYVERTERDKDEAALWHGAFLGEAEAWRAEMKRYEEEATEKRRL